MSRHQETRAQPKCPIAPRQRAPSPCSSLCIDKVQQVQGLEADALTGAPKPDDAQRASPSAVMPQQDKKQDVGCRPVRGGNDHGADDTLEPI